MNGKDSDRMPRKCSSAGPLRHVRDAFTYSCAGYRTALADETAFRLVCLEAVLLVPAALLLGSGAAEKILLLLPSALAIIVELLNSGLENAVDRISLERHPLSKKAKDLGSAAQMSTQILLILVWGIWLVWGGA